MSPSRRKQEPYGRPSGILGGGASAGGGVQSVFSPSGMKRCRARRSAQSIMSGSRAASVHSCEGIAADIQTISIRAGLRRDVALEQPVPLGGAGGAEQLEVLARQVEVRATPSGGQLRGARAAFRVPLLARATGVVQVREEGDDVAMRAATSARRLPVSATRAQCATPCTHAGESRYCSKIAFRNRREMSRHHSMPEHERWSCPSQGLVCRIGCRRQVQSGASAMVVLGSSTAGLSSRRPREITWWRSKLSLCLTLPPVAHSPMAPRSICRVSSCGSAVGSWQVKSAHR